MEVYQAALETNKELCDILRFLVKDQAFHEEFIVTLLLEYIVNNKKGERASQ